MLSVIMPSVVSIYYDNECRYAECRYTKCHYAECRGVKWTSLRCGAS
jgi:hypothetical protein